MARFDEPVVELVGVRFSYGSVSVLRGVDLRLGPGELCVLVGANGAGKSTIVRLVLGDLAADAGDVRLFGGPASGAQIRAVGYVPQRVPAAYDHFPATVREVVAASVVRRTGGDDPVGLAGAELARAWASRRLSGRSARARVAAALHETGVGELSSRMIGRLSGGQLQRVMLARALVNGPRLLVLDEPTTGLDAESVAAFYRTVERRRRERGVAVLLVTHDLVHVPSLCGRVMLLDNGVLREVAPEEAAAGAGVSKADPGERPTCVDAWGEGLR